MSQREHLPAPRPGPADLAPGGWEREAAPPDVGERLARAEIDVQIATAKRYPRSVSRFLEKAKSMATIDPEVAATCSFAKPVDGKTVTGPSIRLAEIVAATYGNLRTAARVVGEDDRFLLVQGLCLDLEENIAYQVDVRRKITYRDGRRYNDSLIETHTAAAMSIALRNAIFRAVPRAMVDVVLRAAQACARGDEKSLGERRDAALAFFGRQGVPPERVLAALGLPGAADVTLDHLATLQGWATALRDAEATVEELFPEAGAAAPQPAHAGGAALAQRLRGKD